MPTKSKKKPARKTARKAPAKTKAKPKPKPKKVQAIPPGYYTATPYLVIKGAANAIDFYKKAFGAAERSRMPGPGGLLMHAEITIGNSIVMICDEMPGMQRWLSPESLKGTTSAVHLYVNDADAVFARAVAAGANPTMPLMDMFWGDRFGKLTDPFGHEWTLATHKHDYTPEEIKNNSDAFFAQFQKQ
jgi:PhnB protein